MLFLAPAMILPVAVGLWVQARSAATLHGGTEAAVVVAELHARVWAGPREASAGGPVETNECGGLQEVATRESPWT